MHDYDRRHIASEETLTHRDWYHVDQSDIEKLAASILSEYSTRLDKVSRPKHVRDYVIEIDGTTTDGRTFRSEVTFFMKDMTFRSIAKTHVGGAVSMSPVPDALMKMESFVSRLLDACKAVGFEQRQIMRTFENSIQPDIEKWRQGEIIDVKSLKSTLRYMVKSLEGLQREFAKEALKPVEERIGDRVPDGDTQPLRLLVDATRKAIGAAVCSLP
jgi:hypothetical protein